MFSSSARGQTEPLAALAAVFVVAIGLSVYAGVLDEALPDSPDRDLAEPTLDRVERSIAPAGVVQPTRLDGVTDVGPDGHSLNVTVTAADRRWTVGPTPPNETVDTASTRVAVETSKTRVEPGTLEVVTWR